jgi:type II secretory pathway pseudopilin PulG
MRQRTTEEAGPLAGLRGAVAIPVARAATAEAAQRRRLIVVVKVARLAQQAAHLHARAAPLILRVGGLGRAGALCARGR